MGISVKEVKQRVKERIGEDLFLIPERVTDYFTSNIFTRTFAYVFGWTKEGKAVKLRATGVGALKVASVGGGFTEVERKTGIATAVLSGFLHFSSTTSRQIIDTGTEDMYFFPSWDGITVTTGIKCVAEKQNEFEFECKAFKVQKAGINDVDFDIVGLR